MGSQEEEITVSQLASHNTRESLWIGVHGSVYDVTAFSTAHPGGVEVLVNCAGADGTEAYDYAGHSELNTAKLQQYRIGPLAGADPPPPAPPIAPSLAPQASARGVAFPKLTLSGTTIKQAAALLAMTLCICLGVLQLQRVESPQMKAVGGSFWAGMAVASSASCLGLGYLYRIFLSTLNYDNDIFAFPPTVPRKRKTKR